MRPKLFGLVAGTVLLLSNGFAVLAEEPDGTIKITTRMVAPGIGLSWGDGILTYKAQEIPFTFQANGLFRNVDENITAAELSGQVFNLNSAADFAGNYQKIEEKDAEAGAGSQATMKNEKGVVVNLVSIVAGRKFNLSREGLKVEFKTQKPSSDSNSRRTKMLAANTTVELFLDESPHGAWLGAHHAAPLHPAGEGSRVIWHGRHRRQPE